jgi:predicted ATP-grasp superfamily ATP-dependent carboligase
MDNSFSEGVEMLKQFITKFSSNSKFFKKRKEMKKERGVGWRNRKMEEEKDKEGD